jgi:coproporphyrinogen III oxidase
MALAHSQRVSKVNATGSATCCSTVPRTRAALTHRRRSTTATTAAAQQAMAAATGSSSADFGAFEKYVLDLQDRILTEAERLDGSGRKFERDRWSRGADNAGYGITCVLEGGDLLEKAAANISIIHGQLSAQRAQVGETARVNADRPFLACV